MVYNEQLVAKRIAELRRQKCLSQEDLAEMVHISVTTLWRLESGHQQIMLERVVKMVNIFGCTVDDLVHDFLDHPKANSICKHSGEGGVVCQQYRKRNWKITVNYVRQEIMGVYSPQIYRAISLLAVEI